MERRKRSRTPIREKTRSPETLSGSSDTKVSEAVPESSDLEEQMRIMMGFSGFDTTKGKKVEGADVGAVNIKKRRQYRQYMNRRGGFNRPLDGK